MSLHNPDHRALARRALRQADPRMAQLIDHYGDLWPVHASPAFARLVRIVVGQQISVKAAATVYGRLARQCQGPVTAATVARMTDAELHACGLSRQKRAALTDLATRTLDRRLRPDQLWRLDDDGVRAAVTSVRGLGPWSAEIFLMFGLGRPDLLPLDDLGLRAGFQAFLGRRSSPTPALMERSSRSWRPWRTLACIYLWALLDNPPTSAEKS